MNPLLTASNRQLLHDSAVFGHLDATEIDAVLARMAWLSLPGGWSLYRAGEPSNAVYVVKCGSVGLFDGAARVGLLGAGSCIGTLGLVTSQARLWAVRALRDTELLQLNRDDFDALLGEHPQAMLGAGRSALEHMLSEPDRGATVAPRTLALLPFDTHVPVAALAAQLAAAFAADGGCTVVASRVGRGRDSQWFAARELETRHVIYVDDCGNPEWRWQCIRQSDALLFAVNAGRRADAWPEPAMAHAENVLHRPRHLLLLHPEGRILAGAARRWRAIFHGEIRHHHVRDGGDAARLARLLSGRATGLVLSGGGARGFAQLGALRALREAGIEIDSVGGCSMGAIVGAGVASQWSDAELRARCHHAFIEGKPLADWTLPLVALTRGRRSSQLLRQTFGPGDIEDLPLPYFCVSSDLTRGVAAVHREGPLWLWLRASSAVPGIQPPVFHQGRVHVDGAVINDLPTDVMHADGIADIIAIDIRSDDVLTTTVEEAALPSAWQLLMQRRRRPRRPGIFSLLLRAGMVNAGAAGVAQRQLASLLLAPQLDNIGLLDWDAFERAIDAGYRQTVEQLGNIARR